MNSLYKDSRSRSFHSKCSRIVCVRWAIHVVTMEADAPITEPRAAANAVTAVASISHRRQESYFQVFDSVLIALHQSFSRLISQYFHRSIVPRVDANHDD